MFNFTTHDVATENLCNNNSIQKRRKVNEQRTQNINKVMAHAVVIGVHVVVNANTDNIFH